MNKDIIPELVTCEGVIVYSPLHDEVDPLLFSAVRSIQNKIVIPFDSEACVGEWVDRCTEFKSKNICVCVPGTAFDMTGTRHGRGGGWYDRFLSRIPCAWTRIGIASSKSLAQDTVLKRQPWDEPVDYILVYDAITFSSKVYEASLRRPCRGR